VTYFVSKEPMNGVGTINRYAMLADVIETFRRRKLDDDPAVAVRQPPMRVNISE
jgi:hypothetical protein